MKTKQIKTTDLRMLKRWAIAGITWEIGSIVGAGSDEEEKQMIGREARKLERLADKIRKL